MWNRRNLLASTAASVGAFSLATATSAQGTTGTEADIEIGVDLKKNEGPLEHIWSKCAGSDRAAISLRQDYRSDLARFHNEAGLQRVRFHGIFNDELGVYAPSLMSLKKVPNWQNVDRVYDGLLDLGVRPYVELDFMPKNLASGKATFGFYGANITPPTSLDDWSAFIKLFVEHLIARYGVDEVRQWPFEVWNEPNLRFFWGGAQADYFALYKATALAVKSVDSRLMIGGPSTSSIQWIPEFLSFCHDNSVPVDFVSTHLYAGDDQVPLFGKADAFSTNDVIPAGVAKVRAQIDASAYPNLPFWLTEWSSDSPAMIAHVIKGCLGKCQAMSHWAFTNVYEELGVANFVLKEGDNGYGMIAVGNIPKPQFNTYKLLHALGNSRLAAGDGPVLATRRSDGSSAIAVWNLAEVAQAAGIPGSSLERHVIGTAKTYKVVLRGAKPGQAVKVTYVDQQRGSPYPAWRKLGSPQYPTREEIAVIRKSAELQAPQTLNLGRESELTLVLPPECVALIELTKVP